MARIVLRPRASSIVTPASSTAVATTAGQPLISTSASRAPKAIKFLEDEDPADLAEKLNSFSYEVYEEMAALRAFPFTRGVLIQDVDLPGEMGQVDSISTTTVTLWRPRDALLFKTGDVIKASTTNGRVRGTLRAGSATVNRDGLVTTVGVVDTGSVVANANWTAGIAGFVVGDYLFKSVPVNGVNQDRYSNCTVVVSHRLGVVPKWFWVCRTSVGTRQPELTLKAADTGSITFHSTVAAKADIFIVG